MEATQEAEVRVVESPDKGMRFDGGERKRAQSKASIEREKIARILLVEHKGDISSGEILRRVKEKTGTAISEEFLRSIRVSLGMPPSWVDQVGKARARALALAKAKAARAPARSAYSRAAKATAAARKRAGLPIGRLPRPDRLGSGVERKLHSLVAREPEPIPATPGALREALEYLSEKFGIVQLHYARGQEMRIVREQVVVLGPGGLH